MRVEDNYDLVYPPGEPPVLRMLAKRVEELPTGDEWILEPNWDGFRAISAVRSAEKSIPEGKRYRELPQSIAGSEQLGRDANYNPPGQLGRCDNCDFQRASSFHGRSGNLPNPAMWIT